MRSNSDVPDGTEYPVRQTAGSPSANPVSSAISLPRLLRLAGAAPAQVSFVEIPRLDGSVVTLSGPDLEDPSPSFEGGRTPIVRIDGTTTEFIRPLRSDDPSDANGRDQIPAQDGAALAVTLHSGALLGVHVHATPTSVAPGRPVELAAVVHGALPGAPPSAIAWSFGDGTVGHGTRVTHTFPRTPGAYEVIATASGAGDSGGSSEPVYIRVGPASANSSAGGPHSSGGVGGTAAPASGPARSRVATRSAQTAPTARAEAPAPRLPADAAHVARVGTVARRRAVPALARGITPVPLTGSRAPRAPGPQMPRHHTRAPDTPPGRLVTGLLVSGPAPASSTASGSEPQQAPAAGADRGGVLLAPAAGIAFALALATAGGAAEIATRRRWHRRLTTATPTPARE